MLFLKWINGESINMTIHKLELELNVSDEVWGYLQNEAQRRHISLDKVVSEVLEDYFDDPSDEEILASIRQGMEEALAGRVRPVDEVLVELKQEFDFDADES
jgi:predicted transcriptional regulator